MRLVCRSVFLLFLLPVMLLAFTTPVLAGEFSAFISGGGCFHPGEVLSLSISVREQCTGGANCTNISSLSIVDDLSSIYEYLEQITPTDGGIYDSTTHKITWTLGPMPTPPILQGPLWSIATVNFKIKLKSSWLENYPDSFINSAVITINGSTQLTTAPANITVKKTYLPLGNTSTRKGAGHGGAGTDEQIRALGVSWAYDWGLSENSFDNGVYEHVPMVRGEPTDADYSQTFKDKIARLAREHPGSYWLIFNEPDFNAPIMSDGITAARGAEIYHWLRPLIRGADPTAKLIVGGVFNPGMGWLGDFENEYRNKYGTWPELEGWSAHLYVGWADYDEPQDKQKWRDKLQYAINWARLHGNREFWLTEFGCLNDGGTCKKIMEDQVGWLETVPGLNRYAWYDAIDPPCRLLSAVPSISRCELSPLGQLYATFGNPPPTPIPSPTPSYTVQLFRGWNNISWLTGFPTDRTPSLLPGSCYRVSSSSSFRVPFVKSYGGDNSYFTVSGKYPILCNEAVSWGW